METLKNKIKPGYLYQISNDKSTVTTRNIDVIYKFIDKLESQGLKEEQVASTISLRNFTYNIPVSELNW